MLRWALAAYTTTTAKGATRRPPRRYRAGVREEAMTTSEVADDAVCTHLDQVHDVEPRTPDGCEECLQMGSSCTCGCARAAATWAVATARQTDMPRGTTGPLLTRSPGHSSPGRSGVSIRTSSSSRTFRRDRARSSGATMMSTYQSRAEMAQNGSPAHSAPGR